MLMLLFVNVGLMFVVGICCCWGCVGLVGVFFVVGLDFLGRVILGRFVVDGWEIIIGLRCREGLLLLKLVVIIVMCILLLSVLLMMVLKMMFVLGCVVFLMRLVVLWILKMLRFELFWIDSSILCVFLIEVLSSGDLMVSLVVLIVWLVLCVDLMFISVDFVFCMIDFMLVKLRLMRFGVVMRFVMFCILVRSIWLVVVNVLIIEMLWLLILSRWLFGIMMRVLIFFLSFVMFVLVWFWW